MKFVQFISGRSLYDYMEDLQASDVLINPTDARIEDIALLHNKYIEAQRLSWYGILTYELDFEKGVMELISYTQVKGKLKERIVLNKEAAKAAFRSKKLVPGLGTAVFMNAPTLPDYVIYNEQQPRIEEEGGF